MEEANYQRAKTNWQYLIVFLFFSVLVLSCVPQDSIELTYTEIQEAQGYSINKIQFVNDTLVYAAGGIDYNFGISQVSMDGGLTWSLDTVSEKAIIDFDVVGDTLFGVGYSGTLTSVQVDGTKSEARPDGFGFEFTGLAKQSTGYTIGGGIAFQTGFFKQFDNSLNLVSVWDTPGRINSICKTEEGILHAVGYGQIYQSQNDGQTWIPNAAEGDNYQHVFFVNQNHGWIVGQAGSILKTEDGGANYTEIKKPQVNNPDFLRCIHFENEDNGVVVGDDGLVWNSDDGGLNWSVIESLPIYNYSTVFVRDNIAWLGTDQGHILRVFL